MPKRFVSLSFTSTKVQLLQLDKKMVKVEKIVTLDLPKGLINHYMVSDKKAMADLLLGLWQEYKIREKFVGLIIPEFSTFNKVLFLPKIEVSELNEAVRWQAGDFLPMDLKKMILDWKIIGEKNNQYKISLVAVVKELLLSYSSAVSKAGLMPLLVETPTISLERISDGQESKRLIIYANLGEAIVAVVQAKEVIVSSVLGSSDNRGIIWTVKQMFDRYQGSINNKLNIKKIEVGGTQINQQFLNELQMQTKLPIEWIQPKIAGLEAFEIQEYLLPLALQFKDPAEPRSEKTINLLPPKWVKIYKEKHDKSRIMTLAVVSSLIIWGCLLVTSFFYFWFSRQAKIFEQNVIQTKESLPKEILAKVSLVNRLSSKILTITGLQTDPQLVTAQINEVKPAGITITGTKMDLEIGRITISGVSNTRKTLIEFKENLEASDYFSKISLPISSLVQEENLNFDINMIYNPIAKKHK